MPINISGLSVAELKQLVVEAEQLLSKRKQERIQTLRQDILTQVHAAGFTIESLFPGAVASKATLASSRSVTPKYRDPENPLLVWGGRGKRPTWLKEALAAGKTLDAFRID